MNNFDNVISQVIKREIYTPDDYTNAIKSALKTDNREHKKTYILKLATVLPCIIIAMCSMAYATIYVYNMFNSRDGIKTAIEHGYITSGNGKYQVSNNVQIVVNNMLIDNTNLDINFGIILNQCTEEVKSINLKQMIITDEQNRILFSNSNKLLEDFINSQKLNVELDKFSSHYINSGISIKLQGNVNNNFELLCNITPYSSNYPECNKLYINIKELEVFYNNHTDIIEGNWLIEQPLPEKFQNREKYSYSIKDTLEQNIIKLNLFVYNTESDLNITLKTPQGENNTDKLDELFEKFNESNNENHTENYDGYTVTKTEKEYYEEFDKLYKPFKDIYIQNSYGKKFYITKGVNLHGEVLRPYNEDILEYSDIFDLTIYDATEELTLHFIYNNNEFSIKLNRI